MYEKLGEKFEKLRIYMMGIFCVLDKMFDDLKVFRSVHLKVLRAGGFEVLEI